MCKVAYIRQALGFPISRRTKTQMERYVATDSRAVRPWHKMVDEIEKLKSISLQ